MPGERPRAARRSAYDDAGRRRRWLLALVLAAVTLGSGILNLVSVMGGPSHPRWLADVFPLEFIRFSRTLTILTGFALIVSSLNVYKRKKRAWGIVLGLSLFSTLFHLTRGFDYQEALCSFALAVLLLFTHKIFSVKSSTPDLRSGFVRLAIAAAVAVGYGIAGFWLLDQRHFGINFHIGDSIVTTLRVLALSADPRLVAHTHYGHWFLTSLHLITITAALYSGFALFRPALYQLRVVPRERALARQILEQHSRTSLDFFKLWPDKSLFFSPTRRCFLAYGVAGRVALVLGDPVGPEEEIEPTLRAFLEMCRENEWIVGLHQTLPDFVPIYQQLRLKKLKIGDDAIVDLTRFTTAGKAGKEFRSKMRQLEVLGIRSVRYDPPVPEATMKQLKEVSEEWLRIPGRRERGFTLGQFEPEYVRSTQVLTVEDPQGKVLGFLNLITTADHKELSSDLMRRRTDAPNGVMDYLFVKTFLQAKEEGYERFDLGMAPMAGFQEREEATAEERAIHVFFQHLEFLFSFRGLRFYKAKFGPIWEPRYLIYRNALDLPRFGLALRRLSEIKNHALGEGEEESSIDDGV